MTIEETVRMPVEVRIDGESLWVDDELRDDVSIPKDMSEEKAMEIVAALIKRHGRDFAHELPEGWAW